MLSINRFTCFCTINTINIYLFLFLFPMSIDAGEWADAGNWPGRTKLVVFRSHEVELVHILVGKNNERLTGTECNEDAKVREKKEAGKETRIIQRKVP